MPRGGSRPGSGRKPRPVPKAKGIWCGQITEAQRAYIIAHLTPEERYQALVVAAEWKDKNASSSSLV